MILDSYMKYANIGKGHDTRRALERGRAAPVIVNAWRERERRFRVYEEAPGFCPGPRLVTRAHARGPGHVTRHTVSSLRLLFLTATRTCAMFSTPPVRRARRRPSHRLVLHRFLSKLSGSWDSKLE